MKTPTAKKTEIPTKPINRNGFAFRARRDWQRNWELYVIIIPVLMYFILFQYKPMYGALIAFKNYKPALGFLGSPWVGLDNFTRFFTSPFFGRLVRNTLLLSFELLLFGFPAPIILALLINELKSKKFSKTAQTLLYVPHFISTVVICGIVITLTSSTGAITEVLHNFFGIKEQALLNNPSNFLPIYILTELWQTLGWNSIIYLSALSGIDQELYDAAKVDGANRWQQCLHVTLPGIAPTIVIMLILKMGKIFNVGYERVMLLYNPAIYNSADVINTYVYRKGLIDAQFSYSTAVGMFNCLVSFALVMITNKISQKVNGSGLW
jgi:putative aldouronate transport system permease protein